MNEKNNIKKQDINVNVNNKDVYNVMVVITSPAKEQPVITMNF